MSRIIAILVARSRLMLAAGLVSLSASRSGAEPVTPADPVDTVALRLAIGDLMATFGAAYPNGREYLRRLEALETSAAAPDIRQSAAGTPRSP